MEIKKISSILEEVPKWITNGNSRRNPKGHGIHTQKITFCKSHAQNCRNDHVVKEFTIHLSHILCLNNFNIYVSQENKQGNYTHKLASACNSYWSGWFGEYLYIMYCNYGTLSHVIILVSDRLQSTHLKENSCKKRAEYSNTSLSHTNNSYKRFLCFRTDIFQQHSYMTVSS
jgi:hypothetical protein